MKILHEQPTSDAPGEAIVLDLLRRIDEDWIAIHQVPLPKVRKWDRDRKPDFILVVPFHGVLMLEIKSGPNVEYKNGAFKVGADATDPIQQIEGGFFQLKAWHDLKYDGSALRNLTMTCTLGFTAVSPAVADRPNHLTSPQNHHGYQVAYKDAFESPERLKAAVITALAGAKASWGSSAELFGPQEASQWAEARMPSMPMDVSRTAVSGYFIRKREELTEQQQRLYFEHLRIVPKVFISGGWGTGKTFLAKHIAVRSATDGRDVCLIVKRNLLKQQLEEAFRTQDTKLGSIRVEIVDKVLGDKSNRGQFDELVLDQAEDFLSLRILNSIGTLLRGGWSPKSRVKIFADFEHQGYTEKAEVKEILEWLDKQGFVGVDEPPLRHNLRNGRLIAQNVEKISGAKVYSDYLSEDGVVEQVTVEPGPILSIMSENLRRVPARNWQVSQALVDALRKIKQAGYEPQDVVVLTALPRESIFPGEPGAAQSSPAFVERGYDYKLPLEGEVRNGHDGSSERPYQSSEDFMVPHDFSGLTEEWRPKDLDSPNTKDLASNSVTWCTVEEFAGGESLVVVLTDVGLAHKRARQRRLTRGLSRASERAVLILVNEPKLEVD